MKLDDIQAKVAEIKEHGRRGDEERAHAGEDDLRKLFIEYVAKRKDSLGTKARLVLTTDNFNFGRYCA